MDRTTHTQYTWYPTWTGQLIPNTPDIQHGRDYSYPIHLISNMDGTTHTQYIWWCIEYELSSTCWISLSSWWRNQMETFSVLLAFCAGNSPVTGEFPTQRPVTRSFDVFFDLCLNKWLNKQSWGWWFGTPSCSLRLHCNVLTASRQLPPFREGSYSRYSTQQNHIVESPNNISGLVQERRNSIADVLELCLSCTSSSIWSCKIMYSLTWQCAHDIQIRSWTYQGQSTPRPHGWAMQCFCGILEEKNWVLLQSWCRIVFG